MAEYPEGIKYENLPTLEEVDRCFGSLRRGILSYLRGEMTPGQELRFEYVIHRTGLSGVVAGVGAMNG